MRTTATICPTVRLQASGSLFLATPATTANMGTIATICLPELVQFSLLFNTATVCLVFGGTETTETKCLTVRAQVSLLLSTTAITIYRKIFTQLF